MEQKEGIILFVYNMLKDGYSMNFMGERTINIESDEHLCRIITSLTNDKDIAYISISNKITKKKIDMFVNKIEKTTNITKQYDYIQNEINYVIESNKPKYYSDDEIEDVIGDPSLLGKRNVKVKHIVGNIKENKKRRFKFL